MKPLLKIVVLWAALALPSLADASERYVACLKYQTQDGMSKGYKKEVTQYTGSELNNATGTWDYDSFASYVIAFWGEGQATVIKLSWPTVSAMGTEGVDQAGRTWNVAKTSYCF